MQIAMMITGQRAGLYGQIDVVITCPVVGSWRLAFRYSASLLSQLSLCLETLWGVNPAHCHPFISYCFIPTMAEGDGLSVQYVHLRPAESENTSLTLTGANQGFDTQKQLFENSMKS